MPEAGHGPRRPSPGGPEAAAPGPGCGGASRKGGRGAALAEVLTTAPGREAWGMGIHVGKWSDCDRLVEAAYERFGHVDILVNNAGMSPLYPSLDAVTEADEKQR